jgi:HEAT repeat protein
VLLLAVLGGAGYYLWTAKSQQREPQSESAEDGPMQDFLAVESLIARGDDGLPELIAQAASDDRRKRRMAIIGLGRLGPQAADALETVRSRLADEDREVRSAALSAFIEICSDSDDLWKTMARMLEDPDAAIRDSAARVLSETTHHIAIVAQRQTDVKRLLTPEEHQKLIRIVLPLAHTERPETRGLVIRIARAHDQQRDDQQVADMLQGLLNDSNPAVRAAAISEVAQCGAARAEDVSEWLRDENQIVVDAALAAVRWLGSDGERVVPELIALVDKVPDDRLSALISALRLHKSCAKPAVPGLVRRVAALPLDYPPRLGEYLGREVRQHLAIVEALVEIDPDPNVVGPVLKRVLAQKPPEFSQKAAAMLAKVDPGEALRLAAQLIKDIEADPTRGNESVTVTALGALRGLGPSAREAVPLLIRLIEQRNDRQPWVTYYSIAALGGIGPDAAPAVPCLSLLLNQAKTTDNNSWVQGEQVILSLGKIGPAARSAAPAVLDVLDQPLPPKPISSDTQAYAPPYEAAINVLGKIGDDSEQVLSRLLRIADTGAVATAPTADEVAESENQRRIAQSAGIRLRLAALQSLIPLCRQADHSQIVLPNLICALDDEDVGVRLCAACLGQIQGDKKAAVPSLINALDDDDPWVVSAAALSLREIGPAALSAAPTLRKLAEDGRNRDASLIHTGRNYQLLMLQFDTGGFDLDRLSVTEAARLALKVLETTGD